MPRRTGVNPEGRRASFIVCAFGAAMVLSVSLAGCVGSTPQPAPSEMSTATPTVTPRPDPTLQPELSATVNLVYFDFIAAGVLKANPAADGKAFIDALVAGGFDKTQMEVTFDQTAVELAADSIQFSVRFNEQCLIGQNGPATDGYQSTVAPILGTGTCLVGSTRQIDW